MAVLLQISCVIVLLLGSVSASVLPVEKCVLSDSKCMTAAFQKAIPLFSAGIRNAGVEVLDPLHVDDIFFDISGLKFSLKGGVFRGMKTSKINYVNWDLAKKMVSVDYHLNGKATGNYTVNGKIFNLPIEGDGKITIVLKKLWLAMHIDYKIERGADGKDHVIPTKYDYRFEVKDNAHFNLTNIFGGDRTLSTALHRVLNENWKLVSLEFGRPLLNAAATKIFKSVVNFFKKEPINDIAYVK